ncbi:hypothetical protein BU14_0643s0004 [Porphyra umbilicalis]|uniref:DNA damage-binding protein 2 n=1 Tax=Porphyra umbilicalis TaxID=2786 RepID=A0A1X6NQX0_PORUM|nr:hypothetical protein BU14_0643s0004 [Porphyra umbilicalis]|eukprot:OSX70886.1 hypothetical protein BU14_0643s0004 [Porphyra umbilicalis]
MLRRSGRRRTIVEAAGVRAAAADHDDEEPRGDSDADDDSDGDSGSDRTWEDDDASADGGPTVRGDTFLTTPVTPARGAAAIGASADAGNLASTLSRPALRLRLNRRLSAVTPALPLRQTSSLATGQRELSVAAAATTASALRSSPPAGGSTGGAVGGGAAAAAPPPDASVDAGAEATPRGPRPVGSGHFNYNDGRCIYCDVDPWHARRYCPVRECYLCRRAGHIFTDCPHRVAGVALPGSAAAAADAPRAVPSPPPRGALTTPRYLAARASTPSPPALRDRLRRRHRLGGAVAVAAAAVRMLPTRVTALGLPAAHPRLVVAADAAGAVGVWRHDLLGGERGGDGAVSDCITTAPVHVGGTAVTGVASDAARDGDGVYTTGVDGSLRRLCLAAFEPGAGAGGAAAPHTTTLLAAADVGCADATGFASVTVDAGSGLVYVGDSRGRVHRVDPRAPRAAAGGTWRAHAQRRVNSVAVNAGDGRLLATAGSDRAVRLWDVRRLPAGGGAGGGGGSSVGRRTAGAVGGATANRSIYGAAFSPYTGTRLLAMAAVPAPAGAPAGRAHAAAAAATPSSMLIHSHDWAGYPASFVASWDSHADNWRKTGFVCGRFLGQEVASVTPTGRRRVRPVTVHPVDLFDAPDGRAWRHATALADARLNTVCTLNELHPTAAVLATGSSYSVYLWAPVRDEDDGGDGGGGGGRKGGGGGAVAPQTGSAGRRRLTRTTTGMAGGPAAVGVERSATRRPPSRSPPVSSSRRLGIGRRVWGARGEWLPPAPVCPRASRGGTRGERSARARAPRFVPRAAAHTRA